MGDGHDGYTTAPVIQVESDKSFDTKIEEKLEGVNIAITEISNLCVQVLNMKLNLRTSLAEGKEELISLYKSNRKNIERARPYHLLRAQTNKAKCDFLERAKEFHVACSEFEEAKENEMAAERAMRDHVTSGGEGMEDPDLLANLNKANDRVLQASHVKCRAAERQQKDMDVLSALDHRLAQTRTQLQQPIDKSWAYYETRHKFQLDIQKQQQAVEAEERKLNAAKKRYHDIFSKLGHITAEIEQHAYVIDGCADDKDLSKFEEIDDIQCTSLELLDLEFLTQDENLSASKQSNAHETEVISGESADSGLHPDHSCKNSDPTQAQCTEALLLQKPDSSREPPDLSRNNSHAVFPVSCRDTRKSIKEAKRSSLASLTSSNSDGKLPRLRELSVIDLEH